MRFVSGVSLLLDSLVQWFRLPSSELGVVATRNDQLAWWFGRLGVRTHRHILSGIVILHGCLESKLRRRSPPSCSTRRSQHQRA